MYNKSGVTKTKGVISNQILFNTDLQLSVGIVVSNAESVTEGGRKLVKAGTPLKGNLDVRTTPFTVGENKAAGILLHDVDVTNGNANGTLLIFGFVNTARIDQTTAEKITEQVKTDLAGKVTFIKE